MQNCVPENLKSRRKKVPSISSSCTLATNSHCRAANIRCQPNCSLTSALQTEHNSVCYSRTKQEKLPVCLLGSTAATLTAAFLL